MSTRSKAKAAAAAKARPRKSEVSEKENEFCSCRRGDDGSPMVYCQECKDWYHFACVNLSERDAEDINVFICPTCSEKTGLRSVMLWEGPDAVEEAGAPKPPQKPKKTEKTERLAVRDIPDSDSDNDPSSQDEYVAESVRAKGTKRRTRRLAAYSDSGSDSSSSSERPARRRVTHSPGAKRKSTGNAPAAKRKKTASSEATEDPTRKYCLAKLEEVFRDIFIRYPHVREGEELVEKKKEELSEAEMAKLIEDANQFATDLEHCVYETYSEHDKQGRVSAGGNYKDRFRMLQFNLSKVDRVVLHKRIASGHISAPEIAVMSSTDLANEETKQSIKIAEQEALEHSILQKTTAPRAKITHKGLQDIEIEDVTEAAGLRERERQRELEQEERMERERSARVKAAQITRQRTASVSVPPESPMTPQSVTWGAPPPVPTHALTDVSDASKPLVFVSDVVMAEPEMDLGDLINIDDEPAQDIANSPSAAVPAEPDPPPPPETPSTPTIPSPVVGISPFASNVKPEAPRSTFDLNSLWSAPARSEEKPPPGASDEAPKDAVMEPPGPSSTDQDFDMFLQENDQPEASPGASQAAFDARERVWTGKINMPLDSTIPQETPVIARQMAGRPLEADSPLWKALFPSDLLRIDGRVPVDKSAQFLLQIRMNPSKELIAVAFSPASANDSGFKILMDFLIAKGRHGLVFPWGSRPKDTHPGRELYIIPLLSSDPLPDYMQLLDNLQLPKTRQVNYLIGIWILVKGKLKAPTPPPVAPTPHPSIPSITSELSQLLPQLSSTIAKLPVNIDQNVLAAEVAHLTPAQIQEMLRTLGAVPNASAPLIPSRPMQPQPPMPPGIVPSTQPPWPNPGYPPYYNGLAPPAFPPRGPPPPGMLPPGHGPPPGDVPHAQYGRPPYDHSGAPGGDHRRGGDRHDRGRRGGRGGRNGRRDNSPSRSQDSGWPRRGGPTQSGSPAQRRW